MSNNISFYLDSNGYVVDWRFAEIDGTLLD